MSHIPNSAMPHAGPSNAGDETGKGSLQDRFGQIAGKVREHPGTAAAAGAAVVAGLAAAAIPVLRARRRGSGS